MKKGGMGRRRWILLPHMNLCLFCLLDLFLDVHGKHIRSCRDGQLLNHTVPGKASRGQFSSI